VNDRATRPEVAVGAIVRRGTALLLIRRAQPPAAGQWSLPGGRVEFGESLVDAVAREVLEETGVAVTVGEFVGWVERIGDDPPHHFVILDFRATPVDVHASPVAADDAVDVGWVEQSDLAGTNLVPGLLEFLVATGAVT